MGLQIPRILGSNYIPSCRDRPSGGPAPGEAKNTGKNRYGELKFIFGILKLSILNPMTTQFRNAILGLIHADPQELDQLISLCSFKKFHKNEVLSLPGKIPQEVFFIASGILRVIVTDAKGIEHTIHFASENQFVADYSSFLLQQPGIYTLQALEPLEVVVMPRSAIEWGYQSMREGDKFGRKVAEFYFIYQDNRVKNNYSRTPKERYELMESIFPKIHQRVPQHMIASYLGITPVHLSRLKKAKG